MEHQANAPADVRTVVDFLRNKSGMKVKTGILNGKRVDYFKGRSAIKAVLSPAYAKLKGVTRATSETEASALLHLMIPFTFFLRVDRGASVSGTGGSKLIQINPQQLFHPDHYYAWFVEANPIRQMIAAVGMVAVVLAGVMFPLWPVTLRVGVWYLSMGVLGLIGLFFAIAIFRLIFWVVTIVVAKPGIWIFPKLFDDVGFVDSFIPLWAWDLPVKKGKGGHRKKDKKEGKSSKAGSGAGTPLAGEDVPRIQELAEGEE